MFSTQNMGEHHIEWTIDKTWDGRDVEHDPIKLQLSPTTSGNCLFLKVQAPFFNDPSNPGGKKGQPFLGLWEYEVVEIFFANAKNQYVEIEICPWGQHIVLLLNGTRKCIRHSLPLVFDVDIVDQQWTGQVRIPLEYLPADVTKMNAYAIHGSGSKRVYEALYPVPEGKYQDPDFHRLDYFRPVVDLKELISTDLTQWSNIWLESLNSPQQ